MKVQSTESEADTKERRLRLVKMVKMIDVLSIGPVIGVGFGFWIHKRYERKEADRLLNPPSATSPTTGDRELDVVLGLAAPLAKPLVESIVQS